MKQKHAGIIRHEDFPDIDFNENSLLDVIQDDKSDDGESSLPAEVDRDEDDTPLESLLAEKHQQVTQDEKCQKALRVQDSFGSMDNINEGVCSSFYDYNNEPTHFTSPNEDYFVPCSEVNPVSLHERQNYPSYIKSGAVEIESNNLPQCYYQTADYNSNYPQYEMESGGHLASLLLNSILMSDQQTLPDSTNLRDLNVPVSCTPSSGVFAQDNIVSPFTQMKSEPLSNNLAVSSQFYDTNSDATLSTLKEFERLLMINRSFWIVRSLESYLYSLIFRDNLFKEINVIIINIIITEENMYMKRTNKDLFAPKFSHVCYICLQLLSKLVWIQFNTL